VNGIRGSPCVEDRAGLDLSKSWSRRTGVSQNLQHERGSPQRYTFDRCPVLRRCGDRTSELRIAGFQRAVAAAHWSQVTLLEQTSGRIAKRLNRRGLHTQRHRRETGVEEFIDLPPSSVAGARW